MNKYKGPVSLFLMLLVIILCVIAYTNSTNGTNIFETAETTQQYTYTDLIEKIDAGEVTNVKIKKNESLSDYGIVTATLSDGKTIFETDVPSLSVFTEYADEKVREGTLKVEVEKIPEFSMIVQMLPSIILTVIMLIVIVTMFQRMQGGGGKMMSFAKSKAKVTIDDQNKVTFENVAGLEEEKTELAEVVEFLKEPKKFMDLGARIPKGVLLVGPPGTGKTLLARAVAGEARVPFFSISGSDFVEMFVGVGASRVRDLFDQAKRNSPCIIFIDEIDAVGRRRGAGLGGGSDEREQTLNQLLVEMDGFGVNEGVIVIAATNRADILDPAILRTGRFDRQVYVGSPDVRGREAILKVHSKGKPFDDDVDLSIVAKTTAGFTGADLANLLNEAALLSARDGKKKINMAEIQKAFVKVGVGTEKKSRVISDKEKLITAYHESGHAILFEVLEHLDPVHSISIIPTGMAGGYTMPLPGEDRMYITKNQMHEEIVSFLGGRAAEYIIFKDVTTGASNDIQRATAMARDMVMKYGMSDRLGPIQFGDESDEVFIGRELGRARNYGEEIASSIDDEVKEIITGAYSEALKLINENIDVLHATAKLLMEKEKVTGDEFRALFKGEVDFEIEAEKNADEAEKETIKPEKEEAENKKRSVSLEKQELQGQE